MVRMGLRVILRMHMFAPIVKPMVLIVEDDPDISDLLALALELHGYVVETAPDGEAALRTLRLHPRPDAALIDLCMPRMDGEQLLLCLRRGRLCEHMPIAFITAEPERARHLGYPVFAKPLCLHELLTYLDTSV